jgi:hypothetical protein
VSVTLLEVLFCESPTGAASPESKCFDSEIINLRRVGDAGPASLNDVLPTRIDGVNSLRAGRETEVAGLVLYSANPWFATELATKYLGGRHFAWVSDFFDTEREAPAGSSGHLIAPSSNPRKIYEDLLYEYRSQEEHSRIIRDHRKTFQRLAKQWLADGTLNSPQYEEIVASVRARSWRIWKPVLYVIPKAGIAPDRIVEVQRKDRAGYGPEKQIADLRAHEFDIIDLSGLVRSL